MKVAVVDQKQDVLAQGAELEPRAEDVAVAKLQTPEAEHLKVEVIKAGLVVAKGTEEGQGHELIRHHLEKKAATN